MRANGTRLESIAGADDWIDEPTRSGWVRADKSLRNDPQVARLGLQIVTRDAMIVTRDASVTLAIGVLLQLWMIADDRADNLDVVDMTEAELNAAIGIPGVARMLAPDWLTISDEGIIKIPSYHHHSIKRIKARQLSAQRSLRYRQRQKMLAKATDNPQIDRKEKLNDSEIPKDQIDQKSSRQAVTLRHAPVTRDAKIVTRDEKYTYSDLKSENLLPSLPHTPIIPFPPPSLPLADQISEPLAETRRKIFAHWQAVHGHAKAKLDPKRARAIDRALKLGYTVAQLQDCITGYTHSSYHMGTDPRSNGTRYDDIELFFRDAAHIDRGIQLHDQHGQSIDDSDDF